LRTEAFLFASLPSPFLLFISSLHLPLRKSLSVGNLLFRSSPRTSARYLPSPKVEAPIFFPKDSFGLLFFYGFFPGPGDVVLASRSPTGPGTRFFPFSPDVFFFDSIFFLQQRIPWAASPTGCFAPRRPLPSVPTQNLFFLPRVAFTPQPPTIVLPRDFVTSPRFSFSPLSPFFFFPEVKRQLLCQETSTPRRVRRLSPPLRDSNSLRLLLVRITSSAYFPSLSGPLSLVPSRSEGVWRRP